MIQIEMKLVSLLIDILENTNSFESAPAKYTYEYDLLPVYICYVSYCQIMEVRIVN